MVLSNFRRKEQFITALNNIPSGEVPLMDEEENHRPLHAEVAINVVELHVFSLELLLQFLLN